MQQPAGWNCRSLGCLAAHAPISAVRSQCCWKLILGAGQTPRGKRGGKKQRGKNACWLLAFTGWQGEWVREREYGLWWSFTVVSRALYRSCSLANLKILKYCFSVLFFSWIFHIEVSYEVAVLVLIRLLNYLRLVDATEVLSISRFVWFIHL